MRDVTITANKKLIDVDSQLGLFHEAGLAYGKSKWSWTDEELINGIRAVTLILNFLNGMGEQGSMVSYALRMRQHSLYEYARARKLDVTP